MKRTFLLRLTAAQAKRLEDGLKSQFRFGGIKVTYNSFTALLDIEFATMGRNL